MHHTKRSRNCEITFHKPDLVINTGKQVFVVISDYFVNWSHSLVIFLLKIGSILKQKIQTVKVVKECCHMSGNPTIRIFTVDHFFFVWQVFENEVHKMDVVGASSNMQTCSSILSLLFS